MVKSKKQVNDEHKKRQDSYTKNMDKILNKEASEFMKRTKLRNR